MHHAHTATARAVALAIGSLSLVAPLAPSVHAGLVGGGGSHDWSGGVSTSWHNPGNWTTGQVPGTDAAAIVLGGTPTVFLNGNSANLSSLFIGGGRVVSTNGHLLRTRMSGSTTTVTGADAELFVVNNGNALAFDAGTLSVSNGARLFMAGGRARVVQQLTVGAGGSIIGHGSVEVDSANAVAFNAHFADSLTVFGGDLAVSVAGGGALALPSTIDVLQTNRELSVDAPLWFPVAQVNLGPNTGVHFAQDWTLGGGVSVVPGSNAPAFVDGDGWMSVTGGIEVANNRTLHVDGQVHYLNGSTTTVGNGATIEFNEVHRANGGSSMGIAPGATARFNGPQIPGLPWLGSITVTAGRLETNSRSGLWISNGPVILNSSAGVRPRLGGSATTRLFNSLDVNGIGAVVEGTLELVLGADMHLFGAATPLIVEGTLGLGNSNTIGNGRIEIADGGAAFIQQSATIAVDLVNAGDLHLGAAPGAVVYKYVNGSLTQTATGRMLIDIAGPMAAQRDVWETSGAVTLDGTLDVQLVGDYQPIVGDTFEILWSNGAMNGAFASLSGATGFSVSYETAPNRVVLTYVGETAEPLLGDLNGDGLVDGADLGILLANWGACADCGDCIDCGDCVADLDGDCMVDGSDLGILLANWTI